MERYLGVKNRARAKEAEEQLLQEQQTEIDEDAAYAREHVAESGHARRIIWEMVGEGEDPIIAKVMDEELEVKEQKLAKVRRQAEDLPTVRVPPSKPGRPSWIFVDVGDKFASSRSREVQRNAQQWSAVVQRQRRASRRTI